MSVADIIARGQQAFTNQQIADMALQADQMARALRRARRWQEADRYQREADQLASHIQ